MTGRVRPRSGRVAAGTAAALLVATMAAPGVGAQDQASAEDHPLRTAGEAAERISFVGVLQMRWAAEGKDHTETLLVQGAQGDIVVRGGSAVMASPQQRLVEHGDVWDLLWPSRQVGRDRPDPALKYQLVTGQVASVAGRPTELVEVRDGGALLERLYLDAESGLLLRREHFDAARGGQVRPVRSIGFETLTIGAAASPPAPPGKVVDVAPRLISAGRLPEGVSAPSGLADGYERLGIYRRAKVTQVLYSDGLYDLSVFQQEGRLDRSGLPGGERVAIGRGTGWHYDWPGGHLVVWEAGHMVHTAVSDAPLQQVLAAIGSMPVSDDSDSLVERLRRVCRALVQPFAD
jgi:sigma-E factor negative regulatory protein RseB